MEDEEAVVPVGVFFFWGGGEVGWGGGGVGTQSMQGGSP